MNNIISEYQKWKQQGEDLRVQAKQAMESRYKDLLMEAMEIAEEFRSDFGKTLKPPAGVTSFRYKSSAKAKARPVAPIRPPVMSQMSWPWFGIQRMPVAASSF